MKGFLKNYTSDVPVSVTVGRIENVLIRCGVSAIAKEYTGVNGEIAALTFKIQLDGSPAWPIRFPVNKEQALQALWLNYADGEELADNGNSIKWGGPSGKKKKTRHDFRQQAERTAWKIMQDWIECQMSMIQMKQADFREVFLPYLWDGKQTYYKSIEAAHFKGLLPEKTEP